MLFIMHNIKQIRLAVKMPQMDLAKALNLSKQAYCNIENKRFTPSHIDSLKADIKIILVPLLKAKIEAMQADLDNHKAMLAEHSLKPDSIYFEH